MIRKPKDEKYDLPVFIGRGNSRHKVALGLGLVCSSTSVETNTLKERFILDNPEN